MCSHEVTHKYDEQHRNRPKSPTLPASNYYAEKSDDSANGGNISNPFSKVSLIVHDSFEWKDETDVDCQDRVDRKAKQEKI